jgi:aspartate aminotransferase
MRTAFERRRGLIVKLLNEIPGLNVNNPMGAFYIFPECKSYLGKSYNGKAVNTAADLAMFLLEEAHVACVGGDAFGAPGYIRLSYATSDENITEAIARIKAALPKLS